MNDLRDRIRAFNRARDWEQFHSPKNLAMALTTETAEVLEHFRWVSDSASAALPDAVRAELKHEIGDVLICLINLADKLGIDPETAAWDKLEMNEARYPVDKARGNAKKWTEHRE